MVGEVLLLRGLGKWRLRLFGVERGFVVGEVFLLRGLGKWRLRLFGVERGLLLGRRCCWGSRVKSQSPLSPKVERHPGSEQRALKP